MLQAQARRYRPRQTVRRPTGMDLPHTFSRRNLLKLGAALQLLPWIKSSAVAKPSTEGLVFGRDEPFGFDILKSRARDLATKPYVPPPMPDPDLVKTMDYDVEKSTDFDLDRALYSDGKGAYPVTFLTVGRLFPKSVRMYALQDGRAREIIYSSDYYTFPAGSPMERLKSDPSPFAGFEIRQADDKPDLREHEGWARFVGASYFRAVGEADQFGLSARGLAQNTGVANPEEFPDFTHFWIAEGKEDTDPVTVYALLDGPSVAGAYQFILHRGYGTTMEITCELNLRRPVERLGIAPLTSMYWFSETVKATASDWRPEVHDSDGLAIWNGKGERLWRPLLNAPTLQISAFVDENPKGFGLMQRDKNYDHYLDAVYYEKRPCSWVEPLDAWGKGSVQLVEIPTDNEIYDNIIAMWVPAEPNQAGQTLSYRYKLYWRDLDPVTSNLARCVATRLGMGALQGDIRSKNLRKFMLEFQGENLLALDEGENPEPVVTASRGAFSSSWTEVSPDGRRDVWRTQFDLDPAGTDPVEMRCYLRFKGKPLTETWTYRYIPFVSVPR